MSCVPILWDVYVRDTTCLECFDGGLQLLISRQLHNPAFAESQTASLCKRTRGGPAIAPLTQNDMGNEAENGFSKVCVVVRCPGARPTSRDVECDAQIRHLFSQSSLNPCLRCSFGLAWLLLRSWLASLALLLVSPGV